MKIRKLRADEVEFEFDHEEETASIRGNYIDSGDDEQDEKEEEELRERLRNGDDKAWCEIKVKAIWNGFEAESSMSCCSVGEDEEIEDYADSCGLIHNVMEALNDEIEEKFGLLEELIESEEPDAPVEVSPPPEIVIPAEPLAHQRTGVWDAVVNKPRPKPGYWQEK